MELCTFVRFPARLCPDPIGTIGSMSWKTANLQHNFLILLINLLGTF
jgi:hypothetical protein